MHIYLHVKIFFNPMPKIPNTITRTRGERRLPLMFEP